MEARSVKVTLVNNTNFVLEYDGNNSGLARDGVWDQAPPTLIQANQSGSWENGSNGLAGAAGFATFIIRDEDVDSSKNTLRMEWQDPYVGRNEDRASVSNSRKYKISYPPMNNDKNASITYTLVSVG